MLGSKMLGRKKKKKLIIATFSLARRAHMLATEWVPRLPINLLNVSNALRHYGAGAPT